MGSARLARVQFWPALKDLAMYSLRIREDGMREPHWHPITAEMGYMHRGSARMTVMDPDGSLDTWYMNEALPGRPRHACGRPSAARLAYRLAAVAASCSVRSPAWISSPPSVSK